MRGVLKSLKLADMICKQPPIWGAITRCELYKHKILLPIILKDTIRTYQFWRAANTLTATNVDGQLCFLTSSVVTIEWAWRHYCIIQEASGQDDHLFTFYVCRLIIEVNVTNLELVLFQWWSDICWNIEHIQSYNFLRKQSPQYWLNHFKMISRIDNLYFCSKWACTWVLKGALNALSGNLQSWHQLVQTHLA